MLKKPIMKSKEVNSGNSNQYVRLNFGKNTKLSISSSIAVIISCQISSNENHLCFYRLIPRTNARLTAFFPECGA